MTDDDIDPTGPQSRGSAPGAIPDAPVPAPGPGASWGDIERRHRARRVAWIAGGVLALAIAAGVAVALLGPRAGTGPRPGRVPVTGQAPAQAVTSTGDVTTPSVVATSTTPSAAPVAVRPPAVRAPLVAYRFAGALWVCDERGGGARRIAASKAGPFALSPDGRTIAVVDAERRRLLLIDVATRRVLDIGPAELERPAWAADSSFAVYSTLPSGSHDTAIVRVARDGSAPVVVGSGAMPRIASDGAIVAVSASRTSGVPVVVYSRGASRLLGRAIVADAVAATTSTVVFGSAGDPVRGVPASLGSVRRDGTGQRVLRNKPSAPGSAFFGELDISFDGATVVYAEIGDDGYSRIFAIPIRGGHSVRLSGRGDGYPIGFSADGAELIYVDGNALQGEPTRLMAVRLDGTHRRLISDGAGM